MSRDLRNAVRTLAATTLLFGLPPRDIATLLTAALLLTGVGALAGYVPARPASRIDPMQVLRQD